MRQFYYKTIRAGGDDYWEQSELEILGIEREPLRAYSGDRSKEWVVRPTYVSVRDWHKYGKLDYEMVQFCNKKPFPKTVKTGFTKHQSLSFCDTAWPALPPVFGLNKRNILVGLCFDIGSVIPQRIFQYDGGTYGRPYSCSYWSDTMNYVDHTITKKTLLTQLDDIKKDLRYYNEVQGRVRFHHLTPLKIMIFTDNPESRLLAICRKRSLELTTQQYRYTSIEVKIVFYPTSPGSEPREYKLEEQSNNITNYQRWKTPACQPYIDILTHLLPEHAPHQPGKASVATYSSPAGVANYDHAPTSADSIAVNIASNGGGAAAATGGPAGSAAGPTPPFSSSSSSRFVHQGFAPEKYTAMAPIALKLGTLVQQKFMAMVPSHADAIRLAELPNHYTPKMWQSMQGEHFQPTATIIQTQVEFLISKGNFTELKRWLTLPNANTKIFLQNACKNGHLEVITFLIQHVADVNQPSKRDDHTPLSIACQNGHLKVAKLLIAHGADVNKFGKYGRTPLWFACRESHSRVAELLIQHSVDVNKANANDNGTPLHTACQNVNPNLVLLLLTRHANVNKQDANGITPFHYACYNGDVTLVQLLLEHHANVQQPDKDGSTPLHNACEGRGDVKVVKLLLQHSANVHQQDKNGATPLHLACYKQDDVEVVRWLIVYGANVDQVSTSGKTPLYIACQEGHPEVVKLLIQNRANVNQANADGETPLHLACVEQNEAIIGKLLKAGATNHVQNKSGKRPFDYLDKKMLLKVGHITYHHRLARIRLRSSGPELIESKKRIVLRAPSGTGQARGRLIT